MKRFLPAFLLLLSLALPAQERYRWFHHIQATPGKCGPECFSKGIRLYPCFPAYAGIPYFCKKKRL